MTNVCQGEIIAPPRLALAAPNISSDTSAASTSKRSILIYTAVIFEKFIDDHGAFLTSVSLEDNPEVIIAIMGENLNNGHPSPVDFDKQMSVSMPEKASEKIFGRFKENIFTQVSEMCVKISILGGTTDVRFSDLNLLNRFTKI